MKPAQSPNVYLVISEQLYDHHYKIEAMTREEALQKYVVVASNPDRRPDATRYKPTATEKMLTIELYQEGEKDIEADPMTEKMAKYLYVKSRSKNSTYHKEPWEKAAIQTRVDYRRSARYQLNEVSKIAHLTLKRKPMRARRARKAR